MWLVSFDYVIEHMSIFLWGCYNMSLMFDFKDIILLIVFRLMFGFLLTIFATLLWAAHPVPLRQTSLHTLQSMFHMAFLNKTKALVLPINSLRLVKQTSDLNHKNHIRLQQMYAGYPVFGGYAVIHSQHTTKTLSLSSPSNTVITGVVYDALQRDLGSPSAAYLANAKQALYQFKQAYLQASLSEESVTPIIYIDQQSKAIWAYQVSLYAQYPQQIPERPTAIINAQNLQTIVQWNEIKTQRRHVLGRGYGGNLKTHKAEYGLGLDWLPIERDDVRQICYMSNGNVSVIDMAHQYEGQPAIMHFACHTVNPNQKNTVWTGYQGDGYDRSNGGFSPSNDALYIGFMTSKMYQNWYGVPALVENNHPKPFVMRVHFGSNYANAFWDGTQMTFGDGDELFYPLTQLGIGAHEISHGFTEQHSGLYYFGQSGGINESFSDMAAQTAEFYAYGRSSWMIGADVIKQKSGFDAIRYMEKPSRDGMSIDTAQNYDESLDVHHSSGVYNRWFYLLAHIPGWDTRKAFQLMLKANMDYWTPYVTFQEGGCGVLDAAKDLGYDVVLVKQTMEEVGLSSDACIA